MGECKHTPGPWTIGTRKVSKGHWETVKIKIYGPTRPWRSKSLLPEYSDCVATVETDWNSHGEEDANAALISAAPELLEALKLAEDALSSLARTGDVRGYVSQYTRVARAAIAKAEGRNG